MLADALGMLREVWAIGRVRTNGASVDVGKAPNLPSHEEATGGADLPLTAATTPPALQEVS
jgi:hypothetical protein